MHIQEIEAALSRAGVAFQRDFDWTEGWSFAVEGEVVGRGGSIGLLERDLTPWWRTYAEQLPRAAHIAEET